ncbi:hypothetical protein [Roseisolibacter agri]|uniref:Uncharacterized protein n=1 Tax=Roseisolibacter agri TaxID=2014610 RepID=A0AA37QA83_9BACT|nr:hypothetical protein [Roseisolibacter agri]GLC25951.1 hypothetical protein rosag_24640 [Roseisolibacter agri]
MTYWLLDNDHAQYAVDWDVVLRLIRGYHRAVLRYTLAQVTTTSESSWYSPLSWSLPDIKSIEVDWTRVRASVNQRGDEDFATLAEVAVQSVPEMARQLRFMVEQTTRYTNAFLDLQAAVQSENTVRMHRAIETYEDAVSAARFLRDTSADGLMVGAAIMTGGAGLAVLGGASALKGYGKYEDTENVGAAVVYGVGNFAFGAFKLGGRTLAVREEAVVAILQAQWEAGVALIEGRSLGDALAIGSLKLGGPFVDRFFKLPALQRVIKWASVPIKITQQPTAFGFDVSRLVGRMDPADAAKSIADTVATKWLSKSTQKQGVEKGGKALLTRLHEAGAVRPTGRVGTGVLATATHTDDLLLTLAIVNMAKGIGRGL